MGFGLAHQGEPYAFVVSSASCVCTHKLTRAQAHPSPHTLYVQVADGPDSYLSCTLSLAELVCVQVTWMTLTGEGTLTYQQIVHPTRLMTLGENVLQLLS